MSTLETSEEADSHGYFVPMIDMLAGVIFILIIMLAAVSLVSRNDFQTAGTMQKEIKQIQAELDQARQEQKTYIEPRRIAQAAMVLLLGRLQADLATRGIATQIFPDDGHLLVIRPGLFDAGGVGLSADGHRVAGALAAALDEEMPCLAQHTPAGLSCAAYRAAHLDEVTVMATGSSADGGQSAARALTVLSTIAGSRPALLLLQAVDKRRLLDYEADQLAPANAPRPAVPPAVPAPAPAPVSPGATPAQAPAAGLEAPTAAPSASPGVPPDAGGIELAFTMNVPPIPPKK